MKGDTEVALFILFFLSGFAVAHMIDSLELVGWLEVIVTSVTTLFAAFLGAWYAFRLQNKKEAEVLIRNDLKVGNGTIFRLLNLQNRLLNYHAQVLNPVRDHDALFFRLQPSAPMARDEFTPDIDGLSFLFQKEPNLIGEVHTAISKYAASIDAINIRSTLHIDVQRKIEEAGFQQGDDRTWDDLRKIAGERDFHTLQQLTDQLVEIVDSSVVYLGETVDKLSYAITEIHPGRLVLCREET